MPRARGQEQPTLTQPSPRVGLPVPTVPPVIETGLPDLATTEGSHALLPCTARGSPEPDITWEKDGQPVSGAEGKFSIQPSGQLLVRNSEVRLRPGAQRGALATRGAVSIGCTPCSSCDLCGLSPGSWEDRCRRPREQMKTLRL